MLLHKELSGKIIDAFYTVYNELGYGFLEKVYERALYYELVQRGIKCERQKPIPVYYKEQIVGEYYADIIVEDSIILELKAGTLVDAHIYQLMNYLKATDIEVGLLLSFGKEPKFVRKIFMNSKKWKH